MARMYNCSAKQHLLVVHVHEFGEHFVLYMQASKLYKVKPNSHITLRSEAICSFHSKSPKPENLAVLDEPSSSSLEELLLTLTLTEPSKLRENKGIRHLSI